MWIMNKEDFLLCVNNKALLGFWDAGDVNVDSYVQRQEKRG